MDPITALDMEHRSGISQQEVDEFATRMDLVRRHGGKSGDSLVSFSSVLLVDRQGHGGRQERHIRPAQLQRTCLPVQRLEF